MPFFYYVFFGSQLLMYTKNATSLQHAKMSYISYQYVSTG